MLASVVAFAAILAVWANRQLLNTDNWTTTSTELLENRLIREQIGIQLVDGLYENVDVAGEIRAVVPERLRPLAGPAAGALRQLAEQAANEVLSRPRAQALWADANREAQRALLKILEGGGPVVSTSGGAVVLDLRELLGQLQERVGIGGRLQQRLPASAGQITIMTSDRLAAVQRFLKIVRGLPVVLIVLTLALFGAALAVAPGWRRQALRGYGIGLVVAGIAALLTQEQAGEALVNALVRTAAVEPAAAAAWTISTSLLVQAAWATIFYGAVAVVGAWLAGPSRLPSALRRAAAPFAAHLAPTYGVVAVAVGLLVWWGPTPALRSPATALVLVALLLVGTEALRRLIVREHPGADRAATMRGLRERAARTVAGARRSVSARRGTDAGGTAAGAAPDSDERLARLERLSRLKAAGVLNDDELAAEKARILGDPDDASAPGDSTPAPAIPTTGPPTEAPR